MLGFACLIFFCSLFLHHAEAFSTLLGQTGRFVTANTKLGQITGVSVDLDAIMHPVYKGKAEVFLGIPYVQAPIGNLRFQLPKSLAVGTWGARSLNATAYKPMCPQPTPGEALLPQDEDCLYLNIIRPLGTQANAKLPVMVWIHGGGFVSGSYIEYSPTEGIISNLVSRGVIVVALNYRLGTLGFFTTFTNDFPANLGLRDQVEAVKWVRANIDSYGGDVNKMTIFGESSGGCSVSLHTYSPLSRGIFDQAIIESNAVAGSRNFCIRPRDNIGSTSNLQIAKDLCNITDADWQSKNFARLRTCLQAMSWQTLFNKTITMELPGPGIDGPGGFLPDRPEFLMSSRKNYPVMVGACADEGASSFGGVDPSLFTNQSFTQQFLAAAGMVEQTGGDSMQSVVKPLLYQAYGRVNGQEIAPNDNLGWLRATSEVLSDALTRSLHLQEAKLWRDINSNRKVYLFDFEYATDSFNAGVPGMKPVVHTQELPYIFLWSADTFFNLSRGITQMDSSMVNTMGTMWTNFAKYGDPTPDNSLPFKWLPFTTANNYLAINRTTAMQNNYYPKGDILFNQLIPSLTQLSQQQYSQSIYGLK